MKKEYSTPTAEKLEFDYSETVVASSETETDTGRHGDNGKGKGCKKK